MTSLNDQWKFQEATIKSMRHSLANGNQQSMIKRMVASERSQSTGQHAQPVINYSIAVQGGQPRDYDTEIYEREYAIEKENVAVEADQLRGRQGLAPAKFDKKLSRSVKQTLIKGINDLLKESQYIFAGTVDLIKFVDIFQKFNDLSFNYNEYVSDIIRDHEFAHLWHTKLVNLESIFIRIKQKLYNIYNQQYKGDDVIKLPANYNIEYILDIVTQAIAIVNIMLLDKNTTQYLSVENRPLTQVTDGQIEYTPQDELQQTYDPEEEQRKMDEQERKEKELEQQQNKEGDLKEEENKRRKQKFENDNDRRLELERKLTELSGIIEKQKLQYQEMEDRDMTPDKTPLSRNEAELDKMAKEYEDLDPKSTETYKMISDLVALRTAEKLAAEKKLDDRRSLTAPKSGKRRAAFLEDEAAARYALTEATNKLSDAIKREAHYAATGIDIGEVEDGSEDIKKVEPKTDEGESESKSSDAGYADNVLAINAVYRSNPSTPPTEYYEFVYENIVPYMYKNKPSDLQLQSIKSHSCPKFNIAKLADMPLTKKSRSTGPTPFFRNYLKSLSETPNIVNPITPELLAAVETVRPGADSSPNFIKDTTKHLIEALAKP